MYALWDVERCSCITQLHALVGLLATYTCFVIHNTLCGRSNIAIIVLFENNSLGLNNRFAHYGKDN